MSYDYTLVVTSQNSLFIVDGRDSRQCIMNDRLSQQ